MKDQIDTSVFEVLRERFEKNSSEFEEQMREVKAKYPLVALAYSMQRAINVTPTQAARVREQVMELIEALTKDRMKESSRERIRRFNKCVGRARDDAGILECFETYPPM